jgi:membrane protease YdiL (CAAX protease family)
MQKYVPVILFSIISICSGFIGLFLNRITGQTGTQNLGTLIWILTPFLTATILRLFQRNKFSKPVSILPLYQNLGISILFYIFVIGISTIIAILSSSYSFQNFRFEFSVLVAIAISAFIKNIFEEFAWRGYLAPKLDQVGVERNCNHLITGFVWASWHIPFVLQLNTFTQYNLIQYLPQFYLSVIIVSWFYGELRLRTGNIVSSLILHIMVNIITGSVVTFGIIKLTSSGNEFIFSPFDGLIYSLICFGTCYLVNKTIFTKKITI